MKKATKILLAVLLVSTVAIVSACSKSDDDKNRSSVYTKALVAEQATIIELEKARNEIMRLTGMVNELNATSVAKDATIQNLQDDLAKEARWFKVTMFLFIVSLIVNAALIYIVTRKRK